MDDRRRTKAQLIDELRELRQARSLPEPAGVLADRFGHETVRLLHELQVHQIELEAQNTELRQAQATLGADKERYHALFDLASVGCCALSIQGLVTDANRAALVLFGLDSEDQARGFDLFADPSLDQAHRAALARGEVVRYQRRLDFDRIRELSLCPTTRCGAIELDLVLQSLPGGAGYHASLQDLTDRQQPAAEPGR